MATITDLHAHLNALVKIWAYDKTEVNSYLSEKANIVDLATVATSGSYLDLTDTPASHESVYSDMYDVLSTCYMFSKYDSTTGELSLGKLEDISTIDLTTTTTAVVTDDTITYTATVTDVDGDHVKGVYVEFIEGNELIGTGVTNSSGVATYSKVYDESTIVDVTAKIGTYEDDLTMFVKDKYNLLSHNQWSAGEYSKTLPTYVGDSGLSELTNEQSSIGDYSIKHKATADTGRRWVRLIYPLGDNPKENYKILVDVYSPNSDVNIHFAYLTNDYNFLGNIQTVLPQNDSFTTVELTKNIMDNSTYLLITITPLQSNKFVYIDNYNVM